MEATLIVFKPPSVGVGDFCKAFAEFLQNDVYPDHSYLVWKILTTKNFQLMDAFNLISTELGQINPEKISWETKSEETLDFVNQILGVKNKFTKLLCVTDFDDDKIKDIFILLGMPFSRKIFEGTPYFKAVYH